MVKEDAWIVFGNEQKVDKKHRLLEVSWNNFCMND